MSGMFILYISNSTRVARALLMLKLKDCSLLFNFTKLYTEVICMYMQAFPLFKVGGTFKLKLNGEQASL